MMWRYAKYPVALLSIIAFLYVLFTAGWVSAFGWVYSLAFAVSALPQTIKCFKEGHTDGVADGTIFLWILGELGGLVYGFGLGQLPIIFNCGMNTLFVGIIVYYRLWPRKKLHSQT